MKRTFIALAAAGIVLGAPAVFADTSVSASTSLKTSVQERQNAFTEARDKFTQAIQADKQDAKNAASERKQEMETARVEFRSDVAEKTLEHTVAVLNAMTGRLQKLIDRTSSRVQKIGATGADVSASTADLAKANSDLASAKAGIVTLSQVNLTVASGTSTTTIKASLAAAKTDAKDVRTFFQAVKRDLEDALKALPKVKIEGEATTTGAAASAGAQ